MDGSTNESLQDGLASEQIIPDIGAPQCVQETLSGFNEDTGQERTEGCTTLPSFLTTDDCSAQIESVAITSSKEHTGCKYSYFFYLKKSRFVLGTLYE